ncbi:MAG: hypothetical protein PHQ40_18445 [Anaerolineaceae bacterium]|nr:hypothetical protein [Anaerolineaceae bacterium]
MSHRKLTLSFVTGLCLTSLLLPLYRVQAAPSPQEITPGLHGHFHIIGVQTYPDPTWWSRNAINQISADTFDLAGDIITNPFDTCGPATLAMVANFYRPDAQEAVTTIGVMRSIQKAGFYRPPNESGVLDYPALSAVAPAFGLKRAAPDRESGFMTFDDFLSQVRSGKPAIAAMRYHYTSDGRYIPSLTGPAATNHFVIIFGTLIADGHEQLWVFNTHPGANLQEDRHARPEVMDFATFQAAWMMNIKPNMGQAIFYSPEGE